MILQCLPHHPLLAHALNTAHRAWHKLSCPGPHTRTPPTSHTSPPPPRAPRATPVSPHLQHRHQRLRHLVAQEVRQVELLALRLGSPPHERTLDLGCRMQGSGLRVQGSGLRAPGRLHVRCSQSWCGRGAGGCQHSWLWWGGVGWGSDPPGYRGRGSAALTAERACSGRAV